MNGRASVIALAWCTSTLLVSCGSDSADVSPLDLRQRLPPLSVLRPPSLAHDGESESASGTLAARLQRVDTLLAPLSLLETYLTQGGRLERDVAIVLAIDEPPRVAGPTRRYLRHESRLDVESVNDHRFFYLQTEVSGRFDPDNAISERALLLDGATVPATKVGQRGLVSRASGVANLGRGYVRVHLNRRAGEVDPLSSAIQIDYELDEEKESVHLAFLAKPTTTEEERPLALWSLRKIEDGQRFLYSSHATQGRAAYDWLAQQTESGQLVVWHGNGQLWACYAADGLEIGNQDMPALCNDLTQPFPAPNPPPGGGSWPGLPEGIPR